MAWFNYCEPDVGYNNMGYWPNFERESYRRPYYFDAAPVQCRHQGLQLRSEPNYFDNYRRDYHQGRIYTDGRYGVLPHEEVFRRVVAPQWMDDGYRHGGYRVNRYDHHGGPSYGHGNFLHLQDDYDRLDHRHHHRHRSSREVELYVPLCCDKCERKLRKHLEYLEGVETITMDQTSKKVVVFGNVNPSHVLNRARQDKPESEFWHPPYR